MKTSLILFVASLFFSVQTAALALPEPSYNTAKPFHGNLCDGNKINGTALAQYSPQNPPSAAALETCVSVFDKAANAPRPKFPGTGDVSSLAGPISCRSSYRSRSGDILMAALALLIMPNQYRYV